MFFLTLTYLPHKAVAEVSKDKEPIGREFAEFNWFKSQSMSDSNELRVKWFGCHLISDSNHFGCQLIWNSIDLVVSWFEIQMIWLSIGVWFKWFWLSVDLNFKWCGCQLIWDLSDSVVNWSEIQVIRLSIDLRFNLNRLSIDLRFKWFGCQMIWGSSDLIVNWCVMQMILSNEAFLRDFPQKWSFEDQKRSNSARLPSKLKLSRWKTKLFCETSFKIEALKIKNEAFLRDFLQNWHVEQTLDLRITIRFNDFQVDASKVLRLPRKSWAEAYEVL